MQLQHCDTIYQIEILRVSSMYLSLSLVLFLSTSDTASVNRNQRRSHTL